MKLHCMNLLLFFIFYVLFIDNNIILIVLIHKTLKGKERTATIVRFSAMAVMDSDSTSSVERMTVVTKSAILIDSPQTQARRELFNGPPVQNCGRVDHNGSWFSITRIPFRNCCHCVKSSRFQIFSNFLNLKLFKILNFKFSKFLNFKFAKFLNFKNFQFFKISNPKLKHFKKFKI